MYCHSVPYTGNIHAGYSSLLIGDNIQGLFRDMIYIDGKYETFLKFCSANSGQ
jgi:hypothetical protein